MMLMMILMMMMMMTVKILQCKFAKCFMDMNGRIVILENRSGCDLKTNDMKNSQLLMVGNTFRLLINYFKY